MDRDEDYLPNIDAAQQREASKRMDRVISSVVAANQTVTFEEVLDAPKLPRYGLSPDRQVLVRVEAAETGSILDNQWNANELERLLNALKRNGLGSMITLTAAVQTRSMKEVEAKVSELRSLAVPPNVAIVKVEVEPQLNISKEEEGTDQTQKNLNAWKQIMRTLQSSRQQKDISQSCLQKVFRKIGIKSQHMAPILHLREENGEKLAIEFHRIYTWLACVFSNPDNLPPLGDGEYAILSQILHEINESQSQLDVSAHNECMDQAAQIVNTSEEALKPQMFDRDEADLYSVNPLCIPPSLLQFDPQDPSQA